MFSKSESGVYMLIKSKIAKNKHIERVTPERLPKHDVNNQLRNSSYNED